MHFKRLRAREHVASSAIYSPPHSNLLPHSLVCVTDPDVIYTSSPGHVVQYFLVNMTGRYLVSTRREARRKRNSRVPRADAADGFDHETGNDYVNRGCRGRGRAVPPMGIACHNACTTDHRTSDRRSKRCVAHRRHATLIFVTRVPARRVV
ncbi:hypothetical protein PUN28_018876 [Cardiocondyla obscurior]|uniref:Uncharacterized protein n=1 Tax=Cardiocondyla obscurior TaxID=286306 RepID=A0AAW2EGQ5_9HYME